MGIYWLVVMGLLEGDKTDFYKCSSTFFTPFFENCFYNLNNLNNIENNNNNNNDNNNNNGACMRYAWGSTVSRSPAGR